MLRGLARGIFQLPYVLRHYRALGIVVDFATRWIISERIKLATKGSALTQSAADRAQMYAIAFDTNAAKIFFLFFSESYFEGRVARLYETASSAYSAVVKRHAQSCEIYRALGA